MKYLEYFIGKVTCLCWRNRRLITIRWTVWYRYRYRYDISTIRHPERLQHDWSHLIINGCAGQVRRSTVKAPTGAAHTLSLSISSINQRASHYLLYSFKYFTTHTALLLCTALHCRWSYVCGGGTHLCAMVR